MHHPHHLWRYHLSLMTVFEESYCHPIRVWGMVGSHCLLPTHPCILILAVKLCLYLPLATLKMNPVLHSLPSTSLGWNSSLACSLSYSSSSVKAGALSFFSLTHTPSYSDPGLGVKLCLRLPLAILCMNTVFFWCK